MKPLNKEQHEAVTRFIDENLSNRLMPSSVEYILVMFKNKFEVACCDSCADGGHCESDHHDNTQPLNTVDTNNPPRQTEPKSEYWMVLPNDVTSKEVEEFKAMLSKANAKGFIARMHYDPTAEDRLTKEVRSQINLEGSTQEILSRNESEFDSVEMASFNKLNQGNE